MVPRGKEDYKATLGLASPSQGTLVWPIWRVRYGSSGIEVRKEIFFNIANWGLRVWFFPVTYC